MIRGTNANCKITKIEISETTATISLLIFATQATSPAKSFHIYIQDEGTETRTRLDNATYWIDKINSYNSDSNNVDTNKYKEIILKIDITNGNKSKIQLNKWVRSCYIYLIDVTNSLNKIAWTSDKLTLISDEFEVPTISTIKFATSNAETDVTTNDTRANVNIFFKLKYVSERDFNYNNKNILALIRIKSVTTGKVLETKELLTSTDIKNTITTTNKYSYGVPLNVEIILTNKAGDILKTINKIYRPRKKYSRTFVKVGSELRGTIAIYLFLAQEAQHEGE